MIGAEQFALAKPNLHVINAARGGLIDEDALHEALTAGRIAGAALDVYSSEPPTSSPSAAKLLELDNVTLTPHLGASTAEAQEKAGVAVAHSVRLALAGELVPDAVNVAGGAMDDLVRPGVALSDRLGQLFTALAGEAPELLDVVVCGEIASRDVTALKLSALRGVFRNVVTEQVSYVNAPVMADERGITVQLLTEENSGRFRNVIRIRGTLRNGEVVSVSGTLSGVEQAQKLVEVAGHPLDVPLSDHLMVIRYDDGPGLIGQYGAQLGAAGINHAGMPGSGALSGVEQAQKLVEVAGHPLDVPLSDHLMVIRYDDGPGLIGQYGAQLGEAGINIAGMQVSRAGDAPGAEALVILNLDQSVPRELVDRIGESISAHMIHGVDLVY